MMRGQINRNPEGRGGCRRGKDRCIKIGARGVVLLGDLIGGAICTATEP